MTTVLKSTGNTSVLILSYKVESLQKIEKHRAGAGQRGVQADHSKRWLTVPLSLVKEAPIGEETGSHLVPSHRTLQLLHEFHCQSQMYKL